MKCKNCGLPIELDDEGEYVHSPSPKFSGCAYALNSNSFSPDAFAEPAAVPDPLRESHKELLDALKELWFASLGLVPEAYLHEARAAIAKAEGL
jgi:hypothetical protein